MRPLIPMIPMFLAVAPLAGCGGPRAAGDALAVASVRVVCTASLEVDCFDAPSRLCGRAGYDLFTLDGRRAMVGDAGVRTLEARCRQ